MNPRQHIPALDGVRGLAILSVIAHHQLLPFTLKGGFLGVDLFFVLSGYLITNLLIAEAAQTGGVSLKNFYWRRLLRLGPALIVYLFCAALVGTLAPDFSLLETLKTITFALAYATNWRLAVAHSTPLDLAAITWSLSIEEQFYLLWPFAFFLCQIKRVKRSHLIAGLVFVITLIAAHRYALWRDGAYLTRLYYGTDTRADAPLVGCLFAAVASAGYQRGFWKLFLPYAGTICALILLYLFCVSDFSDGWLYAGGYTVIALIAGVVVWSASLVKGGVLNFIYEQKLLRWFGKISYGLYLWHWLVISKMSFPAFGRFESWTKLTAAVGLAALSYYVVEKRFLDLKARFTKVGIE